MQHFKLFCHDYIGQGGHAGDVTTRAVEAGDEPDLDRVAPDREYDGNRPCRSLGRAGRGRTTNSADHCCPTSEQFDCQCMQSIVLMVRPAIFARYIPTLDIAGFIQAPLKGDQSRSVKLLRCGGKKPNHRHRRLLRPRRERPCAGCATEKRDELAPSHSITSSARASTVGGTSRPSVLAVFRLITSSNFVGACTGRSAGFSPFRMRSTYPAAPRYW